MTWLLTRRPGIRGFYLVQTNSFTSFPSEAVKQVKSNNSFLHYEPLSVSAVLIHPPPPPPRTGCGGTEAFRKRLTLTGELTPHLAFWLDSSSA